MTRLLVVAALAALLSAALTPLVRRFALAVGAVDLPGGRRLHLRPTPVLGGLAVFFAMAGALAILAGVDAVFAAGLVGRPQNAAAVALGAAAVLLLGAWDDVRPLTPRMKLAVEGAAALGVAAAGHGVGWVLGFELPVWASIPVAVVWIVAITNAFNLIDGLDGLAAGVGFIVALTLLAVSLHVGNAERATMLALLAGALGGFLPYNFHPARIFLGDSGSLLVGFLMAVLSIQASSKLSAAVAISVPLLALGLPIVETALSFARRLLRSLHVVRREEGKERYELLFGGAGALFTADRRHIHHRLLDLGLTHRNAVLLLYSIAAALCLSAFGLLVVREPNSGLLLGAFAIAAAVGIRRLGYDEMHVLDNGALLPFFDLPQVNRRLLHVLGDLGFVLGCLFAAMLVWNELAWSEEVRLGFVRAAPFVAFAQIAAFVVAGLYRGAYRYLGVADAVVIVRAVALAGVGGGVGMWVAADFDAPPAALLILDGYFLATCVVASRLSFRVLDFFFKKHRNGAQRRVVIYGAGTGGALALREIQGNPALAMTVVAFVDDDAEKRMRTVNGCPIFAVESLGKLAEAGRVDELIVSSPKVSDEKVRRAAARLGEHRLSIRRFSIAWDEIPERSSAPLEA